MSTEKDAFGQTIAEGDRVMIQVGEHCGCIGTVRRVQTYSSGESEYFVQLDRAIPYIIGDITKCQEKKS